MKRLLLLYLSFLFVSLIYGQKFPENKYKSGHSLRDYIEESNERSRVFSQSFYYTRMGFLNPTFGEKIKEGALKARYGLALNNRVALNPVFMDANFYYQNYHSSNFKSLYGKGAEFSASLILMPLNYKTSSVVIPYIGAGYQFADIVGKDSTGTFRANVSSPIWKTGLALHLHEDFYLDFQYKQSMFGNQERKFNQYSMGIGVRGPALRLFWGGVGTVALGLGALALAGML